MHKHPLCPDKHTSLTPGKTRIRQQWMSNSDPTSPCLTISPGALDSFMWSQWQGPIWVCDICQACIHHTQRMRKFYPELKIRRPIHRNIQQATMLLCAAGMAPKIVDIDLASSIKQCLPIVESVVTTLVNARAHAKVLVTFVQRDFLGRKALDKRLNLLSDALPKGARLIRAQPYKSVWSNEHHEYSPGSSMCIAEIQT